MSTKIQEFSDLDLDFIPHPISGDLIPLKNADAVKRSIRNLIFTDVYERPFQPKLGSGIRQMLFEPMNPLTQKSLEISVQDLIRRHEPRASLMSVVVKSNVNEDGYDITITFAVDRISEIITTQIFLERLR